MSMLVGVLSITSDEPVVHLTESWYKGKKITQIERLRLMIKNIH